MMMPRAAYLPASGASCPIAPVRGSLRRVLRISRRVLSTSG